MKLKQTPKQPKQNVKRKTKQEIITFPDFKVDYKAIVSKQYGIGKNLDTYPSGTKNKAQE